MADQPTGSVMQLQVFRETKDLAEVKRRMVAPERRIEDGNLRNHH